MQRIKYIDIYKGIGIILMIMGHIGFGYNFDFYIHAFNMPMFFFISGYLYVLPNFKNLVKRKFNSLILPYLIFGLLNLIICLFLIKNFNILNYFENMFSFNNYHCLEIAGALWFLTCLFFLNIIFSLIFKYFSIRETFLICILLVNLVYFIKIKLPLSIDSAIYMLPIFYMGYMFKKISHKFSSIKTDFIFGTTLIIIFSFILFKNGYVNVRVNMYSNILLFYVNAIFMSIGLYYFSKFIQNLNFSKYVKYFGKYSLVFMCLNQVIIFILNKVGINKNISILIITLFILTMINELFNYIKNKFSSHSVN